MTKYTPNYNLDLYEETDIPNLADQYNGAVGKIDTAVHDVHGEVVETANKLITINETIATLNTQITEVNAELTALGITNAEGAAALLAAINANAAGVAKIPGLETVQQQHTQEINDTMADVAKIEADYFDCTGVWEIQTMPLPYGDSGELYVATNFNHTIIKIWGFLNTEESEIQPSSFVTVPGLNRSGLKASGQIAGWQGGARSFACAGVHMVGMGAANTPSGYLINFDIDADGYVYMATSQSPASTRTIGPHSRLVMFQSPYMIPGAWPVANAE